MKFIIASFVLLAAIQYVHSQALTPAQLAALPLNPQTNLRYDPTTLIQYDPNTGLPITTVAQVQALFPGITVDQLRQYFPYLFSTVTTAPVTATTASVSSFPINAITGLPYNPLTGIQYNPITGAAITTIAQAQLLFPNLTLAQLAVYFPYLFTTTTTTSSINIGTFLTAILNNKLNKWTALFSALGK